jgi:hypothetical protein
VNGNVPPLTVVPGVLDVTNPEIENPLPDPETLFALTENADFPRRLFIEIAPLGTPASVRTADSPSEIVAVDDRPSSVFT